jgi:hypothetical protein
MAREIWLTLPDGKEFELHERLTIGRGPENDLVLDSKKISRDHAMLALRGDRWYLEDRGSFNGTYLNGNRLQPGAPLPLRHADRITVGPEELLFSWPAQAADPESTEPHDELPSAAGPELSHFQRQVVRCLCGPWLAGASLESLPSNEQIAALLGTPGAAGTVKAALRRVYTKAGLSQMQAHAKRRALCRVARQRGWI